MRRLKNLFLCAALFALVFNSLSCRRGGDYFTIALDSNFDTLDFLGAPTVPANAERLRTLMFNTLVKKSESFEYVGDLAKEVSSSFDGSTLNFVLRDGIKFHDGKDLTAADVKYTLDALMKTGGLKKGAFMETVSEQQTPMIQEVIAVDAKTVALKLARPALKNNILSNLVAIPIYPENSNVAGGTPTAGAPPNPGNYTPPPGTGPFKFGRYDSSNNYVEMLANENYFEGAPSIKQLRVKVVSDSNALQAELKSNRVQLAPMTINLSPDTLNDLKKDSALKVEQFTGANIQYLSFNTTVKPFDNPKVRQAIAYALDRDQMINNLLYGQAKIAHSILPEESWAYAAHIKYSFDLNKAKQLLDEAGLKPDANGNRLAKPIEFKIASGNSATQQYALILISQLKAVGLPANLQPIEVNVFLDQLKKGQYEMATARYTGGNHDPIYLRDLFASSEIGKANRTRYSNPEFDKIISQAVNELDRNDKAKQLYSQAQEIVNRDAPLIPLWYPANMVVSSSKVGSVKVQGSGDWYFVKDLTFAP